MPSYNICILMGNLTKDPNLRYTNGGAAVCNFSIAVNRVYTDSNGEKQEAQRQFDSLLQAEPNDPGPLLAQLQLFEKDKLWSQIGQRTADWYRDHREDIQTPLFVAGRLAATQDSVPRETAENILRMVLSDHADSAETISALAVLLQTVDRNDEAARLYRRLLDVRADDVVAMNNLAWILCEHQGKHHEALDLAQKGLEIMPKYIDLIDTRGMVYYRLGEFNEAIKDFNTCTALYTDQATARATTCFHLARAYAKLGQTEAAVESLNKALDLNEKVGGLSTVDLTEAKALLDRLSREGG